jgi:thiosulfate/3-mercaptopyruvate sulfurtransferase
VRQRTPFRRISIEEADGVLGRHDVTVLDVRDAASFRQSHLARAQHASHSNVSALLGRPCRSAPIVIYCYHGNASQEYAQIFSDFGFLEVYSLDGGYEAWQSRSQASAAEQ